MKHAILAIYRRGTLNYQIIPTVPWIKRDVVVSHAMHKSQRNWLDSSQGMDTYLGTMRETSREVGRMSGRFEYAEGWRRHSWLGFSKTDIRPIQPLLHNYYYSISMSKIY